MKTHLIKATFLLTVIASCGLVNAEQATKNDNEYILGAAIVSLPEYSGARDNETRVFPLINIKVGRLSIGGINGIAYELFENDCLKMAATVGYFRGRNENDARYLSGIGSIESSPTLGLTFNKSKDDWRFSLNINRDFSDDVSGIAASFSAGYGYKVSPRMLINVSTDLAWIDSKHASGVYGITQNQSMTSSLPPFSAAAGLESVGVSLNGLYFIDKNWTLNLMLSQRQLLGDAKASPITQQNNPYFVLSGITYRF